MSYLRGWELVIFGAAFIFLMSLYKAQSAGDVVIAQTLLIASITFGIGFLGAFLDRINHPGNERPSNVRMTATELYSASVMRRLVYTIIAAITTWLVYFFPSV